MQAFRFFTLIWLAALFCWIVADLPNIHLALEPQYELPMKPSQGSLKIREDDMGKGHYGASRSGGRRLHKGVDFEGMLGEAVLAVKSGRVIHAGVKGGYGLLVIMRHPDGLESRYAHLSQVVAEVGDWISRGDVLGAVGKTGNANHTNVMPHLHFEIRQNGKALNPNLFFQGA